MNRYLEQLEEGKNAKLIITDLILLIEHDLKKVCANCEFWNTHITTELHGDNLCSLLNASKEHKKLTGRVYIVKTPGQYCESWKGIIVKNKDSSDADMV